VSFVMNMRCIINKFIRIYRYLKRVEATGAHHSGRAVEDMNSLRSLEPWDRGFESHSRQWLSVCVYSVCFVVCVGRRLATG
jgi:hypothetical protein